jgi:glycosyltransferase involved in cell wall biosynthesis
VRTVVSLTSLPLSSDSRTFKEASSFARLGHRSLVIQGAPGPAPCAEYDLEVLTVPSPAGSAPFAARALSRVPALGSPAASVIDGLRHWLIHHRRGVLASAPRADLVWLHGFLGAAAAFALRSRDQASLVYDAHDIYPELSRTYRGSEERAIGYLYRLMDRHAARQADELVTVSPGVADAYAELYGRRARVVRNAWDRRLDKDDGSRLRPAAEIPEDAFLVLVIGNRKPGMAVDVLLDAQARLPEDVWLAFLGAGFQDLTGRDRVRAIEPVAPETINSFVSDADLGVVPYVPATQNLRFALPNGLFHLVSAGLPYLYGDLLEVHAVSREHGAGLPVRPFRGQELAAVIAGLRADGVALEELRRASEGAAHALTWEAEEAILADIVRSQLERA